MSKSLEQFRPGIFFVASSLLAQFKLGPESNYSSGCHVATILDPGETQTGLFWSKESKGTFLSSVSCDTVCWNWFCGCFFFIGGEPISLVLHGVYPVKSAYTKHVSRHFKCPDVSSLTHPRNILDTCPPLRRTRPTQPQGPRLQPPANRPCRPGLHGVGH